MSEQSEALKARAKAFDTAQHLGRQLCRAANSVAANYRSACRARSRAEFASRIGIVAEESDESAQWLDMLAARGLDADRGPQTLRTEAHELEAIFSASYGTAKRNLQRPRE